MRDKNRIIRYKASSKMLARIVELAKRRYGDIPDAIDETVCDAIDSYLDEEEKWPTFLGTVLIMIVHFKIPLLETFAWGKIITPYFKERSYLDKKY